MVVWDKGPIGMGWHYRRSYETVLVGQKPGAACRWFDTTDRVENILRKIPKIIPDAGEHPTPKPIALAAHFIGLHTEYGHLVMDPFMGAGSTLCACLNGGRRAILKAAGWRVVAECKASNGWNREKLGRIRDWQPIYGQQKLRWEVST